LAYAARDKLSFELFEAAEIGVDTRGNIAGRCATAGRAEAVPELFLSV